MIVHLVSCHCTKQNPFLSLNYLRACLHFLFNNWAAFFLMNFHIFFLSSMFNHKILVRHQPQKFLFLLLQVKHILHTAFRFSVSLLFWGHNVETHGEAFSTHIFILLKFILQHTKNCTFKIFFSLSLFVSLMLAKFTKSINFFRSLGASLSSQMIRLIISQFLQTSHRVS